MLTKVYEWTRIANPSPDDDLITKRTATVNALIEIVSSKPVMFTDCVIASICGVSPRFDQNAELVVQVIAAVRAQQPAFPENLAENNLDLRACCALVVGELLARARDSSNIPDDHTQLAASLIISCLSFKGQVSERYLREMLNDLKSVAVAAIQQAGLLRRTRTKSISFIKAIKEAADIPAFWNAAQPQFIAALEAIDRNADLDREELDIFWWAYNGVSLAAGNAFSEIPVGASAACAGIELANLAILPPLPNTSQLVKRVLSEGRDSEELKERALKEFIAEWDSKAIAAFVSLTPNVQGFVRANAALFPLTWGALRQAETNDSNWINDLKKLGDLDPKRKFAPDSVSFQVYNERIALRLANRVME